MSVQKKKLVVRVQAVSETESEKITVNTRHRPQDLYQASQFFVIGQDIRKGQWKLLAARGLNRVV